METAISSVKIVAALEFAAQAHHGQMRKSAGVIPYISHPAAVGSVLMRYGFSEDTVIAGYLHDVVEDTAYTLEDITTRFGERVAELVSWVTERPELPRLEQKAAYVQRLSEAPLEAMAISCADLLCNRSSQLLVLEGGGNPWKAMWPTWSEEKLKDYPTEIVVRDSKRLAVIRTKFASHPLLTETERVVAQVHSKLTMLK